MIETYNKLNNSYKKRLVFHLGCSAGFFSEYNNMILAILYCLKNKIKFILYSSDANFKYENGWEDYFLPFCESTNNPIHSYLNMRGRPKINSIKNFRTFRWFIKANSFYLLAKLSKPFVSFDYYTQDLWNQIRSINMYENYEIPELGINGNLQESCKIIVKLTWKYNVLTQNSINNLLSSVHIPGNYIGLHIRRGDKSIETNFLNINEYVNKAKSLSSIQFIFILTDDYQIIEDIQISLKNSAIYTLCEKNELGYYHQKFIKLQNYFIKSSHEKLFASIEMLNKAQLFIGTFSSNIGIFLGMRMPNNKVYGVDDYSWKFY